jgi:putative oxidoreductase
MEWNTTVHMLKIIGIPAAPLALGIATVIELLGGLALLLGLYTRVSAAIMFLYLIPVTLIMHNFWSVGPLQMSIQLVNFLKNLAIMGGLAVLAGYGPGRYSIGNERFLYDEEYVPPRAEPTATGQRS